MRVFVFMKKEIEWLLKEKYHGKPNKNFNKDIERLKTGEPLDYIIGFTEFLGCRIDLSKKPLIPRSETEYWVEKMINEIKNRKPFGMARGKINKKLFILDIFSGSGCIGIAIMRHIKASKVTFVDKEKKCLEQIKMNLQINFNKKHISNSLELEIKTSRVRYKVIQSDGFSRVKGRFDYIFANPPYIADYRKNPSARLRAILRNRIQESVLKYEPKIALLAGRDGLFYINKFLKESKKYLNKNGTIYMEFDFIQKKKINRLLKKYKYKKWSFQKDQYGRSRYLMVKYTNY